MLKARFFLTLAGVTLALLLTIAATPRAWATDRISEQEAYEIGMEAYYYLYPLISMDITRKMSINHQPGQAPGSGPANTFNHMRAFPPADFKSVVRPNFDTLYSPAWLDLTKEPVIVSAPDTHGRFYILPMMDMWTDVFAAPGKRTSGTKAANFAVVPQGWQGKLPAGVERIESPTPYVWVIGRTQTNGPKDYQAVHKVQDGYRVTPLSSWGKKAKPVRAVIDPSVDMKTPPLDQVNNMPAAKYFSYGAELMKLHPPHITDWSQVARLSRVGMVPGRSFDFDKAPAAVKAGLQRAAVDALKMMRKAATANVNAVNGWEFMTDGMGVYGNDYLHRATIAMVGLGALPTRDAVYPMILTDADGQPMEGGRRYVVHFAKGKLPPVGAFWSLTMYDADGFPVPNKINRFAIGDRDDLKMNPDGSLDIFIQHQSPGADKESNWLPSSAQGRLGLTMRLYAPKAQVLDGSWVPPAVKKVQ